jgi:hypothetical protein
MFGILGVFGVSVSIIIIAIGGGFSGPLPSILHPSTSADLWTVGQGIRQGTVLNYSLTSEGPHSSLSKAIVSMNVVRDAGNAWKVNLSIHNDSVSKNGSILLAKQQLTNVGSTDVTFKRFYEPVESSILSIRDIAREPKYLAIGAPWDSIFVAFSSIPIRVTDHETLQTPAGTFDAFTLSYSVGSKTSRIFITHQNPLPVRAQVYDSEGRLQYQYELVGKRM